MALAVDASTPARVAGNVFGNTNITTASFTAPAGALLIACGAADTGTAAEDTTFSVSDNGGLTWTQRSKADKSNPSANGNGGAACIFTAVTGSSASRTVSLSRSTNTGVQHQMSLKVYVVTGQHGTPIGATGNNNTNTQNAPTLSLFNSTVANSFAFVSICDWSALGLATSGDLTIDTANYSGLIDVLSGYKDIGSTGAETASIDWPGSSASAVTMAAIEVVPASAAAGLTGSALTAGDPILGAPALNQTPIAASYRSHSSQTYGSRTNTTLSPPGGMVNDDILLAIVAAAAPSSEPTIAAPSGFAQIGTVQAVADNSSFTMRVSVFWKRASSESGDYVFTTNGGSACSQQGLLLCLQNCITSGNPVDVSAQAAGSNQSTSTTVFGTDGMVATAPSVTTTVVNDLILYLSSTWGGQPGSVSPPASFTERFDNGVLYAADRVQATAAATGTAEATVNTGLEPWTAYQIAIKGGFSAPSISLSSSSLTAGDATVGAPTLLQRHALTKADLVAGDAVVGVPSLTYFEVEVGNHVLDNGLSGFTSATAIHVCSGKINSYADVATKTLGNKVGIGFAGPSAGSPTGRVITMGAITDGAITASGQALTWAIIDASNSRLLATGPLAAPTQLTEGHTFLLGSIGIRYPK